MYILFSSLSGKQIINMLMLAEQEVAKGTDGKLHVRTKMQSKSRRLQS